MGISRGKAARGLLILAAVIALCSGCSGKGAGSQSPEGTETAQAQPGPEEKEQGTALQAEDSNKGGLTKHQQELVEKVYQELADKDYDAVFSDMVFPENSVLTSDHIGNLFAYTFGPYEKDGKAQIFDEMTKDGCIVFDYGYADGARLSIGIVEDRDTPDGYEVLIQGLNSIYLQKEYQETHLILPSGLTNVCVNGISIDKFADTAYFDDAGEDFAYDPEDLAAYRLVLPLHFYSDGAVSMYKNADEFKGYDLVVTADTSFGKVSGLAGTDALGMVLHIGDCSAKMYFAKDCAKLQKMTADVLQEIFDKVSADDLDIESHRGFYAEGTDGQVIKEQLDALAEYVRGYSESSHVKDITVKELHVFEDGEDDLHRYARYIGQDRVEMAIGVHVEYDDDAAGFDGSLVHRDCKKQLECLVTEEGGAMKFISFDDYYSLRYLLNYTGKDF